MFSLEELRPAWAEIDLGSLAHNMDEVKKNVKKATLITAVVKANAYGHGAVDCAKVFLENGADRLAVATLEEAIELRRKKIEAPILILGYTKRKQYKKVLKYNLIQTLYDYESAKAFSKAAQDLNTIGKIHIKIDTGMGRLGFLVKNKSVKEIIKICQLPNLDIEGIYTHFANADALDKNFTHIQYERFMDMVDKLEESGIYIPIKHVSNSAAIIDLPEYNLDMVRAGIILYGLYPSQDVDTSKLKLKPAMSLKAEISHIKTVPKGFSISYGGTFITERESKIATIPIGYGDGLNRLLSSQGEAFINGKKVPLVGRVCMDQAMLDVTEVEGVSVGQEVTIFGQEGVHIDKLAEKLNTINYELVCMIGRRVPRVYIKEGKTLSIKDYVLNNEILFNE